MNAVCGVPIAGVTLADADAAVDRAPAIAIAVDDTVPENIAAASISARIME